MCFLNVYVYFWSIFLEKNWLHRRSIVIYLFCDLPERSNKNDDVKNKDMRFFLSKLYHERTVIGAFNTLKSSLI